MQDSGSKRGIARVIKKFMDDNEEMELRDYREMVTRAF